MNNSQKKARPIRMDDETYELFEVAFEESNADTKGEYFRSLLDQVLDNETKPEVKEVEIEVEKKLEPNQLLLSLTPAQQFILREHVTRNPGFAQEQNQIIDKLANKPWYATSDIYKPEFQELWVRNIELNEKMEEPEKEEAIKHNMAAFILNMFLLQLINYDLQETEVKIKDIEAFIEEQSSNSNPEEDEDAA